MQIYLERPVGGTNLIALILPGLYVRKDCHGLCTENLAQDLQLVGLCETGKQIYLAIPVVSNDFIRKPFRFLLAPCSATARSMQTKNYKRVSVLTNTHLILAYK